MRLTRAARPVGRHSAGVARVVAEHRRTRLRRPAAPHEHQITDPGAGIQQHRHRQPGHDLQREDGAVRRSRLAAANASNSARCYLAAMGFRWRRPRRVVIGALVTGVLLAGGGATAAALASRPGPFTARDIRIPVLDGPRDNQHVVIDATLFRPAGAGRLPAVLLAHGFGETKASVRGEAIGLARAGFAVLTWSARGFGRSTGQIALDSPGYEVKDTEQLVSWLARQPGILLDHPGDPRVGIAGASYGGAIALLTAGYDHRIDAVVPEITWNNLATALFPNAAGGPAVDGVFKKQWAGPAVHRRDRGFGGSGGCAGPRGQRHWRAEDCRAGGSRVGRRERRGVRAPAAVDLCHVPAGGLARPGHAAGDRHPAGVQPGPGRQPDQRADAHHPGRERLAVRARPGRRDVSPDQVRRHPGGPGLVQRRSRRRQPGECQGRRARDLLVRPLAQGTAVAAGLAPLPGRPHPPAAGGSARASTAQAGAAGTGQPGFAVSRNLGFDPSSGDLSLQVATAPAFPGLGGTRHRLVRLTGPPQFVLNPPGGAPPSMSAIPGLGSLGGGSPGGSLSGESRHRHARSERGLPVRAARRAAPDHRGADGQDPGQRAGRDDAVRQGLRRRPGRERDASVLAGGSAAGQPADVGPGGHGHAAGDGLPVRRRAPGQAGADHDRLRLRHLAAACSVPGRPGQSGDGHAVGPGAGADRRRAGVVGVGRARRGRGAGRGPAADRPEAPDRDRPGRGRRGARRPAGDRRADQALSRRAARRRRPGPARGARPDPRPARAERGRARPPRCGR